MKSESKTQNFIFTCSFFLFLMSYWYAEQISVNTHKYTSVSCQNNTIISIQKANENTALIAV